VARKFRLESEEFLESVRNNARQLMCPLHRKCLSRASLTIREKTYVESINRRLHEHLTVFKYLFLGCVFTEARVKLVFFIFIANGLLTKRPNLWLSLKPDPYRVLVNHSHYWQTAQVFFRLTHRSNTTENAYFAFHVFYLVVQSLPYQLLIVKLNFDLLLLRPQFT
jgi:hypothetical protein